MIWVSPNRAEIREKKAFRAIIEWDQNIEVIYDREKGRSFRRAVSHAGRLA